MIFIYTLSKRGITKGKFIREYSGKGNPPGLGFLQKVFGNSNKTNKPGIPASAKDPLQKLGQHDKTKISAVENKTVEQKEELKKDKTDNKWEGKKWEDKNPYAVEGHRLQYAKPKVHVRPPAEHWDSNNPVLNSSADYIQKHKMYLKTNGIGQLSQSQKEFLEAINTGKIDTPEHMNNYLHKDSSFIKDHPEGLRIGKVKNATNIKPGSVNELPENLGDKPSVTNPEHYCAVGKHEKTKVTEIVVFTSADKIKHKLIDTSNEIHSIETYKVSDTNLLGQNKPQASVSYTIVTSDKEIIVTNQPHLETKDNMYTAYKAFLSSKIGYAYTEDSRRVLAQIVDRDSKDNVVSEVYCKEKRIKDEKSNFNMDVKED